MKKKISGAVDVPKFRYIDDIKRYLDKMEIEVDEAGKLITQQQKLLAGIMKLDIRTLLSASDVFTVTPTDRKSQLKTIKDSKKSDPGLTKIIVKDMKFLKSQYALSADLYDKFKIMEGIETTMTLNFPNRSGPEYIATVAQIKKMKDKISTKLKECLAYLNEIAAKHVPASFVEYLDLIAEKVTEYVIFKESQSFLYVSVSDDGFLVFTNYLLLQDVANEEGDVEPHLYISTQWIVSDQPTVSIELNHEYETPNKLIGTGEEVTSVGGAVKAIADMLALENFSSALGVVPLALMLKVDPTSISPSMFSYPDLIDKVIVDEPTRTFSFKLRKQANSPELVVEIAAQLYKEVKGVLKTKARISMPEKPSKIAGCYVIVFRFTQIAQGGTFNAYDFEFMRDKFNLSNQDLRKIVNIMNRSTGTEKEEHKLTPEANDLSKFTKQSQEEKLKQMKKTYLNKPDEKD